jgi:hypothetical protein
MAQKPEGHCTSLSEQRNPAKVFTNWVWPTIYSNRFAQIACFCRARLEFLDEAKKHPARQAPCVARFLNRRKPELLAIIVAIEAKAVIITHNRA